MRGEGKESVPGNQIKSKSARGGLDQWGGDNLFNCTSH